MAYQVIARKWRPGNFAGLVGQEHISQTLLNALRHGRLHHALLFTGPRGTGKTSAARILAKALRCPNAKDFTPCQVCPECEDIASGRSLNVMEIDGASNNGVDAIRELRDTVGYMPSSGKYKLYIIDEVHMLSTSAFNALLKTLEEPPPHVLFVMATTEAHKIPETVLSRVQRFDFRCIPARLIVSHLESICQSEKVTYENEALWTIARQGAGSMRDSQSFLDQAITFSGGESLTLKRVTEILGLTDRRLILAALSALVKQAEREVIDVLAQVVAAGYEPSLFLRDLLEELRHLLMVKLLGRKPGTVVDLPESELAALGELSDPLSSEDIQILFDMAIKGVEDLSRAPDSRVALEMLLLRMSMAPRLTSIQALLKGAPVHTVATPLAPIAATATPTAVLTPVPTSAQTQPHTPMSSPSRHSDENWEELVKKIKAVNSVIGAQLENCFLHEIKDRRLVLGVAPKMKFLVEKLTTPDFKKKVLNYVTTFWGVGYEIDVLTVEPAAKGQMTPKEQHGKQEQVDRARERQLVEEHPLIKSTRELFKSEIRTIKESKP
jgi:DNA polymerase III subunit gamma/tau